MKIKLMIVLVCLTCVSFVYFTLPSCNSSLAGISACYENDQAIISHTAEAPYQYRILAPYVMGLAASPANHSAWFTTVLMVHLLCFALIFPTLYTWLRRWGNDASATRGVFLMVLLLAFSFFHQYPLSPTSVIELALICATLLLWQRYWIVVMMLILASLNRETSVLLVAIYALLTVADFPQRRYFVRVLGLGGLWVIITAGLHLTLGAAPHVLGLMGTIQGNIEDIRWGLVINIILLPLWIMTAIRYRQSPTMLKRFAWLALVYLFTAFVGGLWAEMVRLSLPAIPLILPLVVAEKPIVDKLAPA